MNRLTIIAPVAEIVVLCESKTCEKNSFIKGTTQTP